VPFHLRDKIGQHLLAVFFGHQAEVERRSQRGLRACGDGVFGGLVVRLDEVPPDLLGEFNEFVCVGLFPSLSATRATMRALSYRNAVAGNSAGVSWDAPTWPSPVSSRTNRPGRLDQSLPAARGGQIARVALHSFVLQRLGYTIAIPGV